jgi:hypothetical protein
LFSISTKGTLRRPVIVVGPIALKIARNECGRACNRYEAQLYRNTTPHRRALLCPVLWASPRGFLLVMRAAVPLSDMMSPEEYQDAVKRWDYKPAKTVAPLSPRRPIGDGTTGAAWRSTIRHQRGATIEENQRRSEGGGD